MGLFEKVKEVNSAFFTLLPLDSILAGYHKTILQTIQDNLSRLSSASLQPDTEHPSTITV